MRDQYVRVTAQRRPLTTALSALLAAVAFLLLPTSSVAAEVQSHRAGGATQFTHGSAGVQFGHGGKSGAHASYGQIGSHPETTPPPPFFSAGAGEAAGRRAHGGPRARTGGDGPPNGRDLAVPQPRGPPSGRERPQLPVAA
ncbi:hypothetical protein [Streptomyces cavernicola]|uniref:Uncharacterized protein n=1 Tax=Streptomyces cavernicola TaxID=3043613 RepID=A0ABT6S2T2_9ACTN|nr:hypothetical protein [Streptomyces sp. B-S-A6]MDI3402395.1 hypothetical protein [Streptomyces sp. B-S-A6]